MLALIAFLTITAYPGYLISDELSAYLLVEKLYRAGEEVAVDYNVDFKIYENITEINDSSFTEKVMNAKFGSSDGLSSIQS